MAKRQGENTLGPSYNSLTPVMYENKSLKRETRNTPDTENSPALAANKRRVSKESRHTGRK